MTYLDAYIGRLDDPSFHWDGGDWNGNVPKRLSPFFPPAREPVFWEVLRRIESGALAGKKTDWGGWVAKVTKQQLLDLMSEIYGGERGADMQVYGQEQLDELRAFVAALEDGAQYALVATEL